MPASRLFAILARTGTRYHSLPCSASCHYRFYWFNTYPAYRAPSHRAANDDMEDRPLRDPDGKDW